MIVACMARRETTEMAFTRINTLMILILYVPQLRIQTLRSMLNNQEHRVTYVSKAITSDYISCFDGVPILKIAKCVTVVSFLFIIVQVAVNRSNHNIEKNTLPVTSNSGSRSVIQPINITRQKEPTSIITLSGREDFLHNHAISPIVVIKRRFILCTIPKVMCSQWRRLLRRIEGVQDWFEGNAHNFKKNGLKYAADFQGPFVTRILNDPDWLKVVVVRNPMTRVISVYLDKFIRENYSKTYYGMNKRLSFVEFVGIISKENHCINDSLNEPFAKKANEHWLLQICFCGLNTIHYDMVGRFENVGHVVDDLERRKVLHSKELSGWGKESNLRFLDPSDMAEKIRKPTSADSRLSEFYTSPWIFDLVRLKYADDIAKFGYEDDVQHMRESLFGSDLR